MNQCQVRLEQHNKWAPRAGGMQHNNEAISQSGCGLLSLLVRREAMASLVRSVPRIKEMTIWSRSAKGTKWLAVAMQQGHAGVWFFIVLQSRLLAQWRASPMDEHMSCFNTTIRDLNRPVRSLSRVHRTKYH